MYLGRFPIPKGGGWRKVPTEGRMALSIIIKAQGTLCWVPHFRNPAPSSQRSKDEEATFNFLLLVRIPTQVWSVNDIPFLPVGQGAL